MMMTTVTNNRMINVSDFNIGEQLIVMRNEDYQRELEKERHNAAYLAKVNEGIRQIRAGKGFEHELIDIDGEKI